MNRQDAKDAKNFMETLLMALMTQHNHVRPAHNPRHDQWSRSTWRSWRRDGSARGGFTLIEVMVVVIVIAVLATLILPTFLGRADKARRATAKQKVSVLETSINLYQTEYGRFPETLNELVTKPADIPDDQWLPPTVKAKDLEDPWGNAFVYRYPGQYGPYDLLSLGADGAEGGEAENADINNWE